MDDLIANVFHMIFEKPVRLPGYDLGEQPTVPSNKALKKLLDKQGKVQREIESIRVTCQHTPRFISYRESDVGGGYEPGIFDIRVACTTCLEEAVVEKSPPLCEQCFGPLQLEVFDGKTETGSSNEKLSVWKDEHARRHAQFMKDPLGTGLFYAQFGVYTCRNKDCVQHDQSKFYITGGD